MVYLLSNSFLYFPVLCNLQNGALQFNTVLLNLASSLNCQRKSHFSNENVLTEKLQKCYVNYDVACDWNEKYE